MAPPAPPSSSSCEQPSAWQDQPADGDDYHNDVHDDAVVIIRLLFGFAFDPVFVQKNQQILKQQCCLCCCYCCWWWCWPRVRWEGDQRRQRQQQQRRVLQVQRWLKWYWRCWWRCWCWRWWWWWWWWWRRPCAWPATKYSWLVDKIRGLPGASAPWCEIWSRWFVW